MVREQIVADSMLVCISTIEVAALRKSQGFKISEAGRSGSLAHRDEQCPKGTRLADERVIGHQILSD
jgi:hypothetical protein